MDGGIGHLSIAYVIVGRGDDGIGADDSVGMASLEPYQRATVFSPSARVRVSFGILRIVVRSPK